ncbi:transcription elongation factor [Westerdykella ornata]|uniref:Transcription elongation factor n=1 Tax=Westerdykella ornata TaxID=318751 RepID=A0A6A6JQE3_WESOR|nr:transcription elongation factor [Westerdykella ornata]KAF2278118.1 transcription elongation factor [Westerdykella ornata]
MDAKEVLLRGKAISKAVAEDEPASSLLKLLSDLKDGVRPTEELLRGTKIGMIVNRLGKHRDPAVRDLANTMVTKWKEEVNRAKRKAAVSGTGASGAGTPKPVASAASSSAPPSGTASPAPGAKRKHHVDPAKRNDQTDGVKWQVYGIQARDGCIKLMYNGLAFMSEDLPDEILTVAKEVEYAAWANAGSEDNAAYRAKIRSLFQNLKNKSNQQLRRRVLSGDIPPNRFVTMTHDEMKSDSRRKEDERLEKENMNEAMVAQVEKSISKEFECGKCKQKKVSYSQAQTRSADEPMTTFCECMNCGNRWKFS